MNIRMFAAHARAVIETRGAVGLSHDSLDDVGSLPPLDEVAAQIVENSQAALEGFQSVAHERAAPALTKT